MEHLPLGLSCSRGSINDDFSFSVPLTSVAFLWRVCGMQIPRPCSSLPWFSFMSPFSKERLSQVTAR